MSIKTKIAALAIASLTVLGGIAATSSDAQAGWKGHHHGHGGFGYGIAAGAILGAGLAGAAYASGPSYDYRRCRWVAQYDQFGNYMGRTRACSYPVY